MANFIVEDIAPDKKDALSVRIAFVYARKAPTYAVYRTDTRVVVQFADDPAVADKQSAMLAQLNPLRGEINGLIDGWRSNEKRQSKVHAFDRRIAEALIMGLEGDVPSALAALADTKKDILDERTSRARFLYLMVASLGAAVSVLIVGLLSAAWFQAHIYGFPSSVRPLGLAAGVGTIGAFFSIALAIRGRTILPDLRFRDNSSDAVLRIVIGAISAAFLIALVKLKAVNIGIGDGAALAADPDKMSGLQVMVIAFIAGFTERLVPDLLAKATATPAANPPAGGPKPANGGGNQPAAGAGGQAAPAAAPSANQIDACGAAAPASPAEATADTELPPARGGVAQPTTTDH